MSRDDEKRPDPEPPLSEPERDLDSLELIAALRDGTLDLDSVDDETLDEALNTPEKLRTAARILGEDLPTAERLVLVRRRSPGVLDWFQSVSVRWSLLAAAAVVVAALFFLPPSSDPPAESPSSIDLAAATTRDLLGEDARTTPSRVVAGGAPDWSRTARGAGLDAAQLARLRAASLMVVSAGRYTSAVRLDRGEVLTLARNVAAECWRASLEGRPATVSLQGLGDEQPWPATVVAFDPRLGLALLRPEREAEGLAVAATFRATDRHRSLGSTEGGMAFAVQSLNMDRADQPAADDRIERGPLDLYADAAYGRGLAGGVVLDSALEICGVVLDGDARDETLRCLRANRVEALRGQVREGLVPPPQVAWMGRPEAARRAGRRGLPSGASVWVELQDSTTDPASVEGVMTWFRREGAASREDFDLAHGHDRRSGASWLLIRREEGDRLLLDADGDGSPDREWRRREEVGSSFDFLGELSGPDRLREDEIASWSELRAWLRDG